MKKYLNIILIFVVLGIVTFAGVYYYVFLRPLRDISKSEAEYKAMAKKIALQRKLIGQSCDDLTSIA